jgi:hypothetical protein
VLPQWRRGEGPKPRRQDAKRIPHAVKSVWALSRPAHRRGVGRGSDRRTKPGTNRLSPCASPVGDGSTRRDSRAQTRHSDESLRHQIPKFSIGRYTEVIAFPSGFPNRHSASALALNPSTRLHWHLVPSVDLSNEVARDPEIARRYSGQSIVRAPPSAICVLPALHGEADLQRPAAPSSISGPSSAP